MAASDSTAAQLAAALAANPAELKARWHLIGPELTRVQFAYLVSHFCAACKDPESAHHNLLRHEQHELLAGTAELFAEAIVSQADKSMVSWRAFSQALVSATLAAGPPPRIATAARLTCSRVAIDGQVVAKSGGGGGSASSMSRSAKLGTGDSAGADMPPTLPICAEIALHFLPRPLNRLLACEPRPDAANGGARHRVTLWQVGKGREDGEMSCSCASVLLEHGPLLACAALVPTVSVAASERAASFGGKPLSVAAVTTGLTIVAGSTHRSLTVWVLSAPPGSSAGKRRYQIDDSIQLPTPAPLTALVPARSPCGTSLLYGGTSAGSVIVWDGATWQVKATYHHPYQASAVVALPALSWLASAATDGSVRIWPHGSTLSDRHAMANANPLTRGISGLAYHEETQQLLVAAGRRVHVWNPVLDERVISLSPHHDTLVGVAALPSLIVSADLSGTVRAYDACCFEHLQSVSLCDGPLPVGVPPFLHQLFHFEHDSLLVSAAGTLHHLTRVDVEPHANHPGPNGPNGGGSGGGGGGGVRRLGGSTTGGTVAGGGGSGVGGGIGGSGGGAGAGATPRALALCLRLGRVLVACGTDVLAFELCSGAPIGGAMEVSNDELSALAIDHTEHTAFAGALNGELIQLLITSTAVQPYRKLTSRHGSSEIVSLRMLSSWGSALRSSSNTHAGSTPRRDPEVERHGSLLLSLSVDGTLNVSSVHEGSVLVTHQHASFGEACAMDVSVPASLVAVGGGCDGEGLLSVHKVADATAVRPHCQAATLSVHRHSLVEISAVAFLPQPPTAAASGTAPSTTPQSPGGAKPSGALATAAGGARSLGARSLLLVADARSTMVLYDVGASGRPPVQLQTWRHPGARTSWLGLTRGASSTRHVIEATIQRVQSASALALAKHADSSAPAPDATRESLRTAAAHLLPAVSASSGARTKPPSLCAPGATSAHPMPTPTRKLAASSSSPALSSHSMAVTAIVVGPHARGGEAHFWTTDDAGGVCAWHVQLPDSEAPGGQVELLKRWRAADEAAVAAGDSVSLTAATLLATGFTTATAVAATAAGATAAAAAGATAAACANGDSAGSLPEVAGSPASATASTDQAALPSAAPVCMPHVLLLATEVGQLSAWDPQKGEALGTSHLGDAMDQAASWQLRLASHNPGDGSGQSASLDSLDDDLREFRPPPSLPLLPLETSDSPRFGDAYDADESMTHAERRQAAIRRHHLLHSYLDGSGQSRRLLEKRQTGQQRRRRRSSGELFSRRPSIERPAAPGHAAAATLGTAAAAGAGKGDAGGTRQAATGAVQSGKATNGAAAAATTSATTAEGDTAVPSEAGGDSSWTQALFQQKLREARRKVNSSWDAVLQYTDQTLAQTRRPAAAPSSVAADGAAAASGARPSPSDSADPASGTAAAPITGFARVKGLPPSTASRGATKL